MRFAARVLALSKVRRFAVFNGLDDCPQTKDEGYDGRGNGFDKDAVCEPQKQIDDQCVTHLLFVGGQPDANGVNRRRRYRQPADDAKVVGACSGDDARKQKNAGCGFIHFITIRYDIADKTNKTDDHGRIGAKKRVGENAEGGVAALPQHHIFFAFFYGGNGKTYRR